MLSLMFDRKFWQSLIKFGGVRKTHAAPEFIPSCHVYLRPNGIWIFPMDVRGGDGGGIGVMGGPAESVARDATESALGEAVIAAISRSRFEPWDYKSPLPGSKAPAGFKSYGDLENGAALLEAWRTGGGFKISAWAAAKGGGYEPVAGAEQDCPGDPSAIGKAIRELSKRCVPRAARAGKRGAMTRIPTSAPNSDPDDAPVSFGYKTSWVAVRASSSQEVAEFLNLKHVVRCSWKDGTQQAYEQKGIFVTPPVDGWIFAVGRVPDAEQADFLTFLEDLSRQFGEAFYFGTHRIVEYQAWASAHSGKIRRAFGYVGEKGQFLLNVGERTPEEEELGTGIEDLECSPDEETVLDLAGNWVLDPRELDLHTEATGPGLYGVP
jgi:hypothetical protein